MLWLAYLVLCVLCCQVFAQRLLIQSLEDEIGAENFTYYRLHRPGSLRVELHSIVGDVDIYVSMESQHPSYDMYDLKSETCGKDIILIESSMERPVFIGLFGHPNYLQSKYHLYIYEVDEAILEDYEYLVNKYERYNDYMYRDDGNKPSSTQDHSTSKKATRHSSSSRDSTIEDELPLWWKILIGIIEFGIEVIL